jgi:hypothetical protein
MPRAARRASRAFFCSSGEPHSPNTVVIDRDGMEFHDRAGLQSIVDAAGLPPFAEIPYFEIDRFDPDSSM